MTSGQEFLQELQHESTVTRRYLEAVPFDQLDFQPHAKSETLGRLAVHVAEIVAWWAEVATHDVLDFTDFKPQEFASNGELLAFFDGLLANASAVLGTVPDTAFEGNWSMKNGDTVYFSLPKKQVVRTFCMNHLVHHRAQLGVYLRLLGVAVPATYGPSADDFEVSLMKVYGG